MFSRFQNDAIVIRDLTTTADLKQIEGLEKEIWGFDGRDALPLTLLIASQVAGAILVGAFDGHALVGFAYEFLGDEHGRVLIHSHMVAVKTAYRNTNLGSKLKLAQRERALKKGISLMTWTFDPLQSSNAYFNFAKLGVVSDTFKIDFYGRTASPLHRLGTDRLLVEWHLNSPRVRQRLETDARALQCEEGDWLLRCDSDGAPEPRVESRLVSRSRLRIEIPGDIDSVWRAQPEVALRWRDATRSAFMSVLAAGFFVAEFTRFERGDQQLGAYHLIAGDMKTYACAMQ